MEINLKNIEQLIFYDKKVQALMPEFRHLFDQWQLGQQISGMKSLGQRSVLDLINSLNVDCIAKLEEYFSEKILINKIDYNLVSHYNLSIDEPNELCKFTGYKDFCLTRNKNQVSVTFWR